MDFCEVLSQYAVFHEMLSWKTIILNSFSLSQTDCIKGHDAQKKYSQRCHEVIECLCCSNKLDLIYDHAINGMGNGNDGMI